MARLFFLILFVPAVCFGGVQGYHAKIAKSRVAAGGLAPTVSVIQDCNTVDTAPMTGWTDAWNGIEATGTTCTGTNQASGNYSSYDTTWNESQEAYYTVSYVGGGASGYWLELFVRSVSDTTGYYIHIEKLSGTDTVELFSSGATPTQIGSTVNQEVDSGDSIWIKAAGSTITAYYKDSAGSWTELISGTNTDHTGSGVCYLGIYQDTEIDDIGCGNL